MTAIFYETIAGAVMVCMFGPWCLNRLADFLTWLLNRSDRKEKIKHAMQDGNL